MEENVMSRRRMLGVAGTASLAGLAVGTLPAQAADKEEKHPAIRKAIKEMKEALTYLENSKKIFGGHRVKAIKAVKEAIEQCEAALKFAEGT